MHPCGHTSQKAHKRYIGHTRAVRTIAKLIHRVALEDVGHAAAKDAGVWAVTNGVEGVPVPHATPRDPCQHMRPSRTT